jgi:hypothetical protein
MIEILERLRLAAGTLAAIAALVLVDAAAAPGAHAQAEPAGPPVWGFVSARYSTGTAGFLFGGYGYGPAFAMVGMVNNPRSGYTEFLGGAGGRFVTGPRVSHAVAFAASHATEAWYAQIYWLPTLAFGSMTVEATVQASAPLEDAGDAQLAINPLTVHLRLAPRVSIGPVAQVALQDGIGPAYAAGAGVRLTVPAGAVTVDLLRGIRAFDHEVRISFRAFY